AGQFYVEALEFVGKALVVDAELMQDGRLEVTNVDAVRHDVVGEIVSLAIDDTGLDAGSGHPDSEAAGMMVTSIIGRSELALRVNRPSELAGPDAGRNVEPA